MLESVRKYIESESDAVGLILLLAVSPLPPFSTLAEVKSQGLYTYLPDIDEIIEGEIQKDSSQKYISKRMRQVLEAAIIANREGSKEPLIRLYNKFFSEISTQLELMDYNLSQLYQFVSIFITLIPSILFSTMIFINSHFSLILLKAISFFSFISSFLGLVIFPWEMMLPSPPYKIFLSFSFVFPLFFLFYNLYMNNPLLLALSISSFPLMILSRRYFSSWISLLDDASKKLDDASTCIWNVFECIGVNEPDELLKAKWFGVSKAVMTSLYLLGIYGIESFSYMLSKLENMYNEYLNAFQTLRSKTRVMLFYSVLEVSISAVIYVFILYTVSYFSSISILQNVPIMIPTKDFVESLKNVVDIILSLNSLSLSILTSIVREGNPMYLGLYLFPICTSVYSSYYFSMFLVKVFFGI